MAHFAQTGPVLGNLARASPVPVHYGRAGFSSENFARAVYLLPHLGGAAVGFSWAEKVLRLFFQPVAGHLERTIRPQPVLAHLFGPTKLGIP